MISFEPLRKILKERGISTYSLRNKCRFNNLDNKTIQRLMADESVSTNTLDALCKILNCDVSEIIKFSPDSHSHKENHNH